MVVIGLVAQPNVVQVAYVPPNECVTWATVGLGYHQTHTPTILNYSVGASTLLPDKPISDSTSTHAAAGDSRQVADYVYLNYQSELRVIEGYLTTAPTMSIGVGFALLSRSLSMIHNFYGVTLLYFGDIPASIRAHMIELGTQSLPTPVDDGTAIPLTLTDGTHVHAARLSLGHWWHVTSVCGTWHHAEVPAIEITLPCPPTGTSRQPLFFGFSTVLFALHGGTACARIGNTSDPTILSLRELGLGVHIAATNVTWYSPNNHEIDHVTAVFVIVCLMLFLWAWLRWTRDIYTTIDDPIQRRIMWRKVSVHYIQFTCAAYLMVLSRNLWAQAQSSHGMYNIETIDVIGLAYAIPHHTSLAHRVVSRARPAPCVVVGFS